MDSTIKEIFEHKGRTCLVVEMNIRMVGAFHNGYVEVSNKNKDKSYHDFVDQIQTDELTFSGKLEDERLKDKYFLGFDSCHFWNDKKPESKTFESVKDRTIELCEEMIKGGI